MEETSSALCGKVGPPSSKLLPPEVSKRTDQDRATVKIKDCGALLGMDMELFIGALVRLSRHALHILVSSSCCCGLAQCMDSS